MTSKDPDRSDRIDRKPATESPASLPPDLTSHSLVQDGSKTGQEPGFKSLLSPSQSDRNETASKPEAVSLPGFQIIGELGRGGMGTVFLAIDQTLGRQVAIKFISQAAISSRELLDRFNSEVKTLASLHHSNIAQLFSAGQHDHQPYFVMEYVDGKTLDEFANEPFSDSEAARLICTLCAAVDYCHQQNVIHRDLKPSNILLTAEGEPKIADFGLAKALDSEHSSTRTGEVLGTPGYMSPEQAGGIVRNIGPGCDIYGLGAILFRLLTMRAPFVAAEPFQTVVQVLADDPISPRKLNASVSKDLETTCLKCLEKKSSNRYPSVAALREDLERFTQGLPIQARPAGVVQRCIKWTRRNPAIAIGFASVVVGIVAAIVALFFHNAILSKELARSRRLADHGSEFAKWITDEHLSDLSKIAGTTEPRVALIETVSQFLQQSYADVPSDSKYTERLGYTYAQLASNLGGSNQNTQGDLQSAKSNYQRAIELYDASFENSDDQPRVIRLKLDATLALADVLAKLNDWEARSEVLADARDLSDRITVQDAETVFLRIQILNRDLDSLMKVNNFQESLALLGQLDPLINKLETYQSPDFKSEVINQRILIASHFGLCYENLGKLAEAEPYFRKMVKLSKSVSDQNPEDVINSRRTATSMVQLGDILFSQKKAEESLRHYENALSISRKLSNLDQASVEGKIDLGVKLSRMATNCQYLSKFEKGETAISEAIEILKTLKSSGKESSAIDQGLMIYLQSCGSLRFLQGKVDSAKSCFVDHTTLCQANLAANPQDTFAMNQLAESQLTQALMVFGTWLGNEVETAKTKSEPEYKTIKKYLSDGRRWYGKIEKIIPLSYHQKQQLKRLNETESFLEQTTSGKNRENVPENR